MMLRRDSVLRSVAVGTTALAALVCLPGVALAQTLLHHYTFDTNADDSVGTANGTLLNGAAVVGGELVLDGVNDIVQFDSHIVPTSGSYSVALFARQDVLQSGFVELISQGSSGGPGFYIGHNTAHNIRVSDSWLSTGVPFGSPGVMRHYAVVVNAVAGESQLFIDGILQATLGIAITTTNGGTNTRLGGQFAPFGEFFDGSIDDVRIYEGALSAGQVEALATGAAAAPEPGTLALIGAATLIGGIALRRRKSSF